MIDAFKMGKFITFLKFNISELIISIYLLGGDFHSRTAMGMYPKLKEEIEKGELLLEWDRS